jgi:hypothetical protein
MPDIRGNEARLAELIELEESDIDMDPLEPESPIFGSPAREDEDVAVDEALLQFALAPLDPAPVPGAPPVAPPAPAVVAQDPPIIVAPPPGAAPAALVASAAGDVD